MLSKSHILEEIRRTARTNHGKPLGRLRFFKETGIKESDWLGKHWARWNDAIREAGLTPNSLQAAFSDDFLLDQLLNVTRDLGRFPTRPELRLRSRNDAQFPDPKVFERFGTKVELARRLAEYCKTQGGGAADVEALALAEAQEARQPRPDSPEVETFGYVYLLKAGRHYKIGRSNAVGRRERELAIQLPERAALVHSIKTDDPVGIEEYWHRRFADKRGNGEWFALSASDVTAFRRRKFM
jgi:Meiotically up-regulated gene 113